MNNPEIILFGESESAFADYSGESTSWNTIQLNTGGALDVNLDSKKPTILYKKLNTNQIAEINISNFSETGFSIPEIDRPCSIQVDYLSGDIYVLSNSILTPKGNNFFGGILYRQKKAEVNPTILEIDTCFFAPQDMKIDPPRRLIWVADTGNHRLVSVNMNTFTVSKVYEFDDLLACCGIAINNATGAIISRWFNTDSLQEIVVFIKDDNILFFDSFSDFPWGGFPSDSNSGDLLLITSKSNKGIYRIKADGSKVKLEASAGNKIPVTISQEPLCGTVSVLYADGSLTCYSNKMEYFGQINYPADSKKILFPCSYGASYWVGNYRDSISAYVPTNSRIEPYVKREISKSIPLKNLVKGICNSANMNPVFLRENGEFLTTISRDGGVIQKNTSLSSKHNLICQDFVNGDIFISIKGGRIIERYTKNHIKLAEYEMPEKIISIDSKNSGDGFLWVLSEDRSVSLAIVGTTSQIISVVYLSGTTPLKNIKSDFVTGGSWVNSSDTVFKISTNGGSVSFIKSGFSEIADIAPINYLSKLYDSDVDFSSSKSMSYDGVRNQAWWLSNPSKRLVGMINFNTNNIRVLEVCDRLFSSSSSSLNSSSSSSFNSSSSSNSSLSSSSSKSSSLNSSSSSSKSSSLNSSSSMNSSLSSSQSSSLNSSSSKSSSSQ